MKCSSLCLDKTEYEHKRTKSIWFSFFRFWYMVYFGLLNVCMTRNTILSMYLPSKFYFTANWNEFEVYVSKYLYWTTLFFIFFTSSPTMLLVGRNFQLNLTYSPIRTSMQMNEGRLWINSRMKIESFNQGVYPFTIYTSIFYRQE